MKRLLTLIIALISCVGFKIIPALASENFLNQNQVIIKSLQEDLNGDGKEESIILTGNQNEDSPFYENIKITVSDLKTGATLYSITPTTNYGYSPNVFVGNFTSDSNLELFYGADSGGSGGFGYFYLYAFNDKVTTLYDYERDFTSFKAKYKNYYKVKVYGNDKTFYIDLSNRDDGYLKSIYNNGILKEDIEADVSAVNYVFPYFNSSINGYSLAVFRRITGLFSADLLGYLVETIDYSISATQPNVYYYLVLR